MIKIDLITGFLGSGKTTFLKKYAHYLIGKGHKIGILVNDYGAVNVDTMLLSELEGDNCGIESVAGACDSHCHQRRFKTKLIALAMSGYDRVLIEPSGVFDVDEFFDSLYEEPLDRWYEIGSVIAVADVNLEPQLSKSAGYILASQACVAGRLVLSKTQLADKSAAEKTVNLINAVLRSHGSRRRFENDVISKPWDELADADFEELENCGYYPPDFTKLQTTDDSGFTSLYFMELGLGAEELKSKVKRLFESKACGGVFRVKGFVKQNDSWLELNAARDGISLTPIDNGQDIVIVIGENLNKEKITEIL